MSIFDHNRELLDRFRRGERAALAQVYEHYVDDVALLARRGFPVAGAAGLRIPGTDLEGEHEVVQDTFVRAFSDGARAAFDGVRPYRPFLLRITRNLMIDRLRASRRPGALAQAIPVDDVLEVHVDLATSPDHDDLHWRSLADATAAFLTGLEPEFREIVRLRFEEELSQDAVAAQLGCTRRRVRTVERTVQVALKRHLKQLRATGTHPARRDGGFFGRLIPVLRRRRTS